MKHSIQSDPVLSQTIPFDEMYDSTGHVREHYANVDAFFKAMSPDLRRYMISTSTRRMVEEGITFTLKGSDGVETMERTIPFDIVPRVIPRREWALLEKGLVQRVRALNAFLWDAYHDQEIMKDGLVPRRMIVGNHYFRPEMVGLDVPNRVYITTSGIDLIRDPSGHYLVLEDNLRSPSGFSYLFKGRSIMASLCPDMYFAESVRGIEQSMNDFLTSLRSLSQSTRDPVVALLTPGRYNSAYFEHAFLAQEMGIELVEGHDLVCRDHKIYIRALGGFRQVDVIYRRLDDDFLDPVAFQPNSLLGVAGLMTSYRAGNVSIANAPGTGIADDKAIYAYVPDMIRYYLNEEPLIQNVPTYILSNPDHLEYALSHLEELVVKETSLSGGYGMLIGPTSSRREIEHFRTLLLLHPERYIAQPTIQLSQSHILTENGLVPRHIDLRAFVLMGESPRVIPGGLTRTAMTEGSLVVNSSQGGGCKDTWVL